MGSDVTGRAGICTNLAILNNNRNKDGTFISEREPPGRHGADRPKGWVKVWLSWSWRKGYFDPLKQPHPDGAAWWQHLSATGYRADMICGAYGNHHQTGIRSWKLNLRDSRVVHSAGVSWPHYPAHKAGCGTVDWVCARTAWWRAVCKDTSKTRASPSIH